MRTGLIKQTLIGGCIIFTVSMAIWTAAGLIFAGPEWGLVVTMTLLAGCAGLAVLQTLWFTDAVVKRLPYPARVAGFGLTAFAVLAGCAYLGRWLPVDDPGAWAGFAIIYLAVLAVMTAGFAIRYRRTARDLDEALRRYRSDHAGPTQ